MPLKRSGQGAFIERMTQLTQRLHPGDELNSLRPTTPSKGGRPRDSTAQTYEFNQCQIYYCPGNRQ